jgi:serine phosphatase RsbU (regulator of sigma subunit)
MKLTLQQVIDLNYELNGLAVKTSEGKTIQISKGILAQKTSMKLKLYLQRLNKVVSDEVKLYDDAKKEIFEKYSVGEGEDKKIPEDKIDEADKEHKDLITAEKEIDVLNLWSGNVTIETLTDIETEENYPVLLKLIDK